MATATTDFEDLDEQYPGLTLSAAPPKATASPLKTLSTADIDQRYPGLSLSDAPPQQKSLSTEDLSQQYPGLTFSDAVPGMEKLGGVPAGPPPVTLEGGRPVIHEVNPGSVTPGSRSRVAPLPEKSAERLLQGQSRFGGGQPGTSPGQATLGEIGQLALIPAAEGVALAASSVESAVARQSLRALSGALSGYFAYQGTKGAVEQSAEAVKSYQKGDYLGAFRNLGAAGISGFFAWLGARQAAGDYQNVADIAKLRNTLQKNLNVESTAAKMADTGPKRIDGQEPPAESSTEPQVPSAPFPAPTVQTPPAAVTIEPGATYNTALGKVSVRKVIGNTVVYDLTQPDGTATQGIRRPISIFQKSLVKTPQPIPDEEREEPDAVAPEEPGQVPATTPVEPEVPQPVSPQPAPPEQALAPVPNVQANEPVVEQPHIATPQPTESAPVEQPLYTSQSDTQEKGSPGWVGKVHPSEVLADPVRFQFKQDVGQRGVSDKLKDAQAYDDEQGGTLAVWKDPADGKTYVVNGHHRLDLANRLNAPEVTVRYLKAKTAQEARLKGAIINIGEDQGTSLDAAKVFRDSGQTTEELAKNGLALKGKIASEGLALSKLSPAIFRDVINGDLKPARGAVIGAGVASHEDQKAVYDLIKAREKAGKRPTDDQVEELIRLNNRTSTITESTADQAQGGLFGEEEMTRSLLPEKAEISDYIRKELASEKKLFSLVGKNVAAEKLSQVGNIIKVGESAAQAEQANQGIDLYDKQSGYAGPIDNTLDAAAQRLAAGENANEVKRSAYREARDYLTEQAGKLSGIPQGDGGGVKGLGGEGPLQVGGGEQPAAIQARKLGRQEGPSLFPPETEAEVLAASPNEILARFTNKEDGLESVVTQGEKGFHATLRDTDAGESIETRIFPTRPAAEAYAKDIAAQAPLGKRQVQPASGKDKLLGDQLTAQFASGMAVKPSKLKPAETRNMFDEGPDQEGLFARRRTPDPNQLSLFDERSTSLERASQPRSPDSPPVARRAPQVDPSSIHRLPSVEIPAEPATLSNVIAYWGGTALRPRYVGGHNVVLVNQPAMDVILRRMGPTGSGQSHAHTIGVTMHPGEWGNIIEEAGAAAKNPRPGGFDHALIRIGAQLKKASAEGKPLIAVQAGMGIPDDVLKRTIEEELDHALQMELPKGLRDLPVEVVDTTAGQAAAAALASVGYPRLNPDSPFFDHNRAIIVAEISVRLMRPGRWQELNITAQQAGDLAEAIVTGLEKHGSKAHAIVEQIYGSVPKSNPDVAPRSGGVQGQDAPVSERGPPGQAEAAPEAQQNVSRVGAEASGVAPIGSQGVGTPGFHYRGKQPIVKPPAPGESESKIVLQSRKPVSEFLKSESGASSVGPLAKSVAKDALQAIAKANEGVAKAKDSILLLFAPAAREGAEGMAMSIRHRAAEQARNIAIADKAMIDARKAMGSLPLDQRWAFYDRAERGLTEPNPELAAIAKVFRKILDKDRADVQALGTGKLNTFIENYLPHIYKDPKKAGEFYAEYISKRPAEGSKSFLHERTHDYLSDAMTAGLEPASENPVDMVMLKHMEVQRYITAHRIMNDAHAEGIVQFVRVSDKPPHGFVRIDDKVATVFGPRKGAVSLPPGTTGVSPSDVTVHGMRIMGQHWAPEPAARVFNNYLSPGLGGYSLFRGYRAMANTLNQFQLGLSAFHLGFTTFDAATSKLALGVYQAAHGSPGKGIVSALKAPLEIVTTPIAIIPKAAEGIINLAGKSFGVEKAGTAFVKATGVQKAWEALAPFSGIVRGDKMLREYYEPNSQGAELGTLVDALMLGGGRAQMDRFYRNNTTQKMLDAFRAAFDPSRTAFERAAKLTGGTLRILPSIVENTAKPIMEWVVPRQKLAVFADLAEFELSRLKPGEDPRPTLARIVDSVDNRMGQMIYDNRFWNKMFKDMLMGSIRAVGWNTGTISEIVGGAVDVRKLLPRPEREQKAITMRQVPPGSGQWVPPQKKWTFTPDMTTKLSYLIAYPMMVIGIGSVIYYLWHGRGPDKLEDTINIPDSHGNKYWLPSYGRDMESVWVEGPMKVAKGKIHPAIGLLNQMLSNSDFFDRPIVRADPHNPFTDRLLQGLTQEADFLSQQYIPMSMRPPSGRAGQQPRNAQERLLPFFGITRVPSGVLDPNKARHFFHPANERSPYGR